MSEFQVVTPDLLGAYRVDEWVVLFTDTQVGFGLFAGMAALPPAKALTAARALVDSFLRMTPQERWDANHHDDGSLSSVLVLPVTSTTLPADFPGGATVCMKPDDDRFAAPRMGQWVSA